jgi:hypothetical protein
MYLSAWIIRWLLSGEGLFKDSQCVRIHTLFLCRLQRICDVELDGVKVNAPALCSGRFRVEFQVRRPTAVTEFFKSFSASPAGKSENCVLKHATKVLSHIRPVHAVILARTFITISHPLVFLIPQCSSHHFMCTYSDINNFTLSKAYVLAAWVLGSWVRIPFEAWMFIFVFLCCALLWRQRHCVGVIRRPGSPTRCQTGL